ncbi:hypothetical protein HMPREF9554_00059 [Treponema phagedenis F0421]|nr:hypothetical protein HMPREF9554_00059 [Treponema phagedenis F0421]
MLKSVSPYCWCSDLYNRKLITKRYTGELSPAEKALRLPHTLLQVIF